MSQNTVNTVNVGNAITTNSIMRQIVTILDEPVKFVLILMIILTIIFLGELIAEYFRRFNIRFKATKAIEAINKDSSSIESIIGKSKLLKAHKNILIDITKHTELSNEMRENLASSLLNDYNRKLEMKIKKTDLIVKLGPTFGLLGTLIPLGPGIIALASGDTATLSYSLLAAFDTTVVGLISGSVSMIISLIRKNWYQKDMIMLTLIMEAILDKINK